MNSENGFFQKMCNDAIQELASGNKSWREVDTNTLLLVCFGMLSNHLSHKITKPLWVFASAVVTGIIGYFIMRLFGV